MFEILLSCLMKLWNRWKLPGISAYKLYKTLNFQSILSCFSSAGNSAWRLLPSSFSTWFKAAWRRPTGHFLNSCFRKRLALYKQSRSLTQNVLCRNQTPDSDKGRHRRRVKAFYNTASKYCCWANRDNRIIYQNSTGTCVNFWSGFMVDILISSTWGQIAESSFDDDLWICIVSLSSGISQSLDPVLFI